MERSMEASGAYGAIAVDLLRKYTTRYTESVLHCIRKQLQGDEIVTEWLVGWLALQHIACYLGIMKHHFCTFFAM